MGLRDAFDALSELLGDYESRGVAVRSVETTADVADGGTLRAVLEVPVSLCGGSEGAFDLAATPTEASVTDREELTVTFAAPEIVPVPATATVVDRKVGVVDGQLVATVTVRFDPDGAADTDDRTTADGGRPESDTQSADGESDRVAAARSPDVPPYDDTEYLRALYESCETFAEMSERIPMDVAAETVRRYMIDAGVHDPSSYDTTDGADEDAPASDASDADETTDGRMASPPAEASEAASDRSPDRPTGHSDAGTGVDAADEQLIADGIGLPDGIYLQDVVEAVTNATTVYEVQRSLELDHHRTHDLLRRLNVLDLLLHRVDRPHEAATERDVVRRIRQCTTADDPVES
jgi:hypothetical protein